MVTTVEHTTRLSAAPDAVWAHVGTPRLLDHVAHPILRFGYPRGFDRDGEWPEGEHRVRMYLFGIVPIGWQIIGIEVPEAEGSRRLLRDNGRGPLIRRWDHWIVVEPAPGGQGTTYTDRVHVEAGVLTPLVAAFANRFYAHRQKRWRDLARTDFAALEG